MATCKLNTNKLTTTFMTITPEIAAEMLTHNTNNRPVSKAYVARLSKQMRSGNWMVTGDPIRFAHTGRLIDGQNRLYAIMKTGITLPNVNVIRGLDERAFLMIDGQRRRTGSDTLFCGGSNHPKETATAVHMIAQYYRTGVMGGYGSVRLADNQELFKAWQSYDTEFLDLVVTVAKRASKPTKRGKRKAFRSIGILSAVGYLMGPGMFDTYERMVDDLVQGWLGDPSSTDPTQKLMEFMRAWSRDMKPSTRLQAALLMKTANAIMQRKKIKSLEWCSDEPFPKSVGIFAVPVAV